jgi:predicted kinase
VSVGSDQTRLIVVRGNSGSGKSTVARQLREAYGRGVAWVSQDLIRRTILTEKDRPGGANIGLIDLVARYSLDNGYHVVLDGIFYADRYETMLAGLARDHLGVSRFYYLDVSLDETFRRHATRPLAAEVTPDQMRDWYRPRDLLGGTCERIIPETSALAQTTALILADTQLLLADRPAEQLADLIVRQDAQASEAASRRSNAADWRPASSRSDRR